MRFINTTRNSVHIEDVDLNIPYLEDMSDQEVDTETIKKSQSFQKLIILGAFKITACNSSRIEQNLLKLAKPLQSKEVAGDEPGDIQEVSILARPQVVLKGHFYDAGGYAKTNRSVAIHLSALGIDVEQRVTNSRINDLNELEVKQLLRANKKISCKLPIYIDSIVPTFSEITMSKGYRILYTTIESESVPNQIVDICNRYNEIWVTSDFCKKVLLNHKVKPDIYVMPQGVNDKLYTINGEKHKFRPNPKKFVFVSVFSWGYRKGYDALLKSYLTNFSAQDDVTLLIISRFQGFSDRSHVIKEEIQKYIDIYGGKNPPHIARCSKVIPEHILPSVYRACDAFVTATRGEGYNMCVQEASLCGLPVIATNHSGHTMFLNKENSSLIDIDKLSRVQKGCMNIHYWDDQIFPELKSEDFIARFGGAMRSVYENYSEAKTRNEKLSELLLSKYKASFCSRVMAERIKEIWRNLK